MTRVIAPVPDQAGSAHPPADNLGAGDVRPPRNAPDDPEPEGPPGPRHPRTELLRLLRRSETPLDAYQLAAATGLHVTTVRFHLGVLVRAQTIGAQKARPTSRGRPRILYTLRTEEPTPDGYRPLAAVLAAHLGPTPSARRRRAEQAGRDWAADLVPAVRHVGDIDEAAHRITELFATMSFDPELVEPTPGGDDREIRIRACPFRDVARDHPEVVCALHLGLMRGALDRLGQDSAMARMAPLVKPRLCLAYLTAGPTPASVPSSSS